MHCASNEVNVNMFIAFPRILKISAILQKMARTRPVLVIFEKYYYFSMKVVYCAPYETNDNSYGAFSKKNQNFEILAKNG